MEASPVNPDYLTELIPYRCPKCGDLQRFATLRELKRHLEGEHSFKMGCIKPRKRLRVFSQVAKDKNKLMDNSIMSPSSGERYSEDSARLSPLLHSYKEETKMLEMQVEFAKQEELRNKLSGRESKEKDTKSSSPNGSGTDFNSAASLSNEKYSNILPSNAPIGNVNSTSFVNHWQTFTNVPSSPSKIDFYSIPPVRSGYTEFKTVLDSLNKEVIRSRQKQWESAESLHKAEDVLLEMEKAAEEKCQEQRRIIQNLLKGLNDKEDTLQSTSNELDSLQFQRQQLLKETENLFYKADERNGILRHEIEQKERQMSCLNREFEKLKFYSETELRRKDEELKNANKAAKRLEWEREKLTSEAEELLKKADLDREGLKKTNERKEEQLRYAYKELDKLRWEQQDLLEQSIELYKKADEGTSILKGMLKAKDQQLNNALEGLKHMREVQARLLEESRLLTQQADENCDMMKKLLVKKEEQFRVAKHELEKLRDDEKNLRESSASFASRAESNSAIIEKLQELVRKKKEELNKTKAELTSLKKFILQTAEKEREARAKLEKFIGELIDRADRAEKEIRTLTRTSDKSSPASQRYIYTDVDDTVNEHVKPSQSPDDGTQSVWSRKLGDDFVTGNHIYESMSAKNIQDDPLARGQRDSKQPPHKSCIKGMINPLGHQIVDLGVDSWLEKYSGFSLCPAVDPVPDQLEKLPDRSITYRMAEETNTDATVVDSARLEEANYLFGVSKHVHDGVNPLQYKATSENQHNASRHEKELVFKQRVELATRGNQRIVQSDVLEYPYATKPKLELHGGELLQTTTRQLLQHDFVGSGRLVNQRAVIVHEQGRYPTETDESEADNPEAQIISNKRYNTFGMEHFDLQPNVSEQRSKAMVEPAGFDNQPEQIPVMLQEHEKGGQHQANTVRNETYGQEAPLEINLNISGHHDFNAQEQYYSDILSPPISFRDYSSMPCGLNDPKYFRNEVDYDDINCQNEPSNDGISTYEPFPYVTKPLCIPSVKLERLHRFSKSETDIPGHLKAPPGHTHDDHGYLNKKHGSGKVTAPSGYNLSQPVEANLKGPFIIIPGPINIKQGVHLSRKAVTSLNEYMLPQHNGVYDYNLTDRPSSSNKHRRKYQSPTAQRRDRRSVAPDRDYEDDRVEDSYTFSGDIIPPRNLKKLLVTPMPIVRPTRRGQDNDEEERKLDTLSDVNKGNFEQIIDENGIIWEDNQDTLPDISDSELDRISPSGTEAASGNTTNCPITPKYREDVSSSSRQSLQSRQNQRALNKKGTIPNSGAVEMSNHSNRQISKFGADVRSDVNMSRQTYENHPQKNQPISSEDENISNSEFVRSDCDNGRRMYVKDTTGSLSASDLHISKRYSSKSLSSNSNSFLKSQSPLDSRSKYLSGEEESKRSKLFQPIKSPIAKNGSDQDLTSGGREVHATLIVQEKNDTKFTSPDSMFFEEFNEANKEERSTDGTLSNSSKYNRNSPISDIPEQLKEENYSVKSDCETSIGNTDLAQKPTRLGLNSETFIRGSPSVKAFKEKLDAVAQKYGVKSRCVKTLEAKQEQSSSYQDKANAIAHKYSFKSIISNPADKADFRKQSNPERATSPEKLQSHSRFSSRRGISSHEERDGSGKQPDKIEHSKYDLHLDDDNNINRDKSSKLYRQHHFDGKPREISQISCNTLPEKSGEINEGRLASSQTEFFSGIERHSCDEIQDQDRKFSNDRFTNSDRRRTLKKRISPHKHESLEETNNAEGRNNSTFSDASSSKMTIPRKSTLPYSSSDAFDKKSKEAEYADDWEMDNAWNDASQHWKVPESPSNKNLNKTDKSSIKHEQGSRNKDKNGQEDKVKEIDSVLSGDVSYEFSDMSHKEEIVKDIDMRMTDTKSDPSSVQNPDDSAKDTFVKHDAGNTLESERNFRSDHSTDVIEMFDNNNIEGLRHNSRVSIHTSFKDENRFPPLSEGQTIKQPVNAVTTIADVHQEDLDDCEEYVPEMDDLPEYAQSLSDFRQPESVFAEPIIESSSIDGDSNAQSLIDQNNLTETELDTDADTCKKSQDFSSGVDKDGFKIRVKRKVYSKSRVKRRTAKRHVISPASSQASLDQLDILPCSRREDTKKRREVLYHVFSFLDTATLSQLAAVCKEWKIVSRNPRLWQRVQLRNDKISSQFLTTISKWCTKLKFLTLEDLKPRNRRWGETLEEYNVKIRACLEPGLEQLLKQCESTLISLRIVNCGQILTSKALWAASGYSRLLQHVTYLSDIDPVGPEVMWALGAGCRDIRTLAIPPLFPCENIKRFNTKCVQLIGKFFHDLEVLNIGGPDVDLTSLVNVAQSCQRLRSVELTYMSEMTHAIATSVCNQGLSKLQTLIFTCTPVALDALKHFFKSCAHLKQITIQLGPKDYFTATKKVNEKGYEAYVSQLQNLKSMPGLGTILQLKVQPISKVEGNEKGERGILSWFTDKFK